MRTLLLPAGQLSAIAWPTVAFPSLALSPTELRSVDFFPRPFKHRVNEWTAALTTVTGCGQTAFEPRMQLRSFADRRPQLRGDGFLWGALTALLRLVRRGVLVPAPVTSDGVEHFLMLFAERIQLEVLFLFSVPLVLDPKNAVIDRAVGDLAVFDGRGPAREVESLVIE